MKRRKCPYCGKTITYFTVFFEKKQGEHICPRCGKEAKLLVKKSMLIYFLIAVAAAAVIATLWIALGFMNNPLGIFCVAVPLVIFYLCTPNFIKILPLKKYKKSMEAAKAAREYGGEIHYKSVNSFQKKDRAGKTAPAREISQESSFTIDSSVFNQIKMNRKKPAAEESSVKYTDAPLEEKNYVPIIENNREAHASSSENVPLQKISREKPENSREIYKEEPAEAKKETPPVKKYGDSSKYSANRRF